MICNISQVRFRSLIALLAFLTVQSAVAGSTPAVSGTYAVVKKTSLGSQEQIQMRIHLVNNGSSALSILRMTLWDLSQPLRGGTRSWAAELAGRASVDTVQEFTIPRLHYQMWEKGMSPSLVLQLAGPGKAKTKTVVRLNRVSAQEVK